MQEGLCHLSIASLTSGIVEKPSAFKNLYPVPNNHLTNDGQVNASTAWRFNTITLPPLMDEDQRLALVGNLDYHKAVLGLDNIRLTTRERCSPRWTKAAGFKLNDVYINSSLSASLDAYEMSEVSQAELAAKHAILEKQPVSLEMCARLCIHGSGKLRCQYK